jgi:hypothetical protein
LIGTNTELTFLNQTLGTTSAAQTITLTNTGTATVTISNIAFERGDTAAKSHMVFCSLAYMGVIRTAEIPIRYTSEQLDTPLGRSGERAEQGMPLGR